MRARIVEALAVGVPRSVRELAETLGVRPESLYYHIHALRKHGLVVEHSRRRHKRRYEAVYALAAPRLKLDRTQRSRRYVDSVIRACELMLRATSRDYRAALYDAGDLATYPPEMLSVRRLVAALDREGLRRLNQLMREIGGLFGHYQAHPGDQVQALTMVLVPRRRRT